MTTVYVVIEEPSCAAYDTGLIAGVYASHAKAEESAEEIRQEWRRSGMRVYEDNPDSPDWDCSVTVRPYVLR